MKTLHVTYRSFLVVFVAAVCVKANAQFNFATNNGTLTIVTYSGSQSAVTIPHETNGMPIVSIGYTAFANIDALRSIVIPDSITSIGQSAFGGCVGLKSVVIPDSVTNIAPGAFSYCTTMTNVVIGTGVKVLNGSFDLCFGLQRIYFRGDAPALGLSEFGGDNATVYYLPGTAGWSFTFGGLQAVLWNPHFLVGDGSFGIQSNSFGFNVAGTGNIPIALEASTNLVSANWQRLQTCTLTNGLVYLNDPGWTNNPVRFYRLCSP